MLPREEELAGGSQHERRHEAVQEQEDVSAAVRVEEHVSDVLDVGRAEHVADHHEGHDACRVDDRIRAVGDGLRIELYA